MQRRRFITAVSAAGGTSLAGCLNTDEPQPEIASIYSKGTTLYAEINNPDQADDVVIEPGSGGESSTVSVSSENPVATYGLGDPGTIGTKDQKFSTGTEFKVWIFVDEQGEVTSKTWTYDPIATVADIHTSKSVGYDPVDYDQKATPVIEVKNVGSGPMRLQELVILDVNDPVQLAGSSSDTIAFARTALARTPGESGVTAVDTHDGGGFFLPEGFSAFYALDGFFTHSGGEPEQTESVEQRFGIDLRWSSDKRQYSVVAELGDGIIKSGGKEEYRFGTYEITEIDYSSPLK
jgi:hypothetical protein